MVRGSRSESDCCPIYLSRMGHERLQVHLEVAASEEAVHGLPQLFLAKAHPDQPNQGHAACNVFEPFPRLRRALPGLFQSKRTCAHPMLKVSSNIRDDFENRNLQSPKLSLMVEK
jgi:hypothetical protein